MTTQLAERIRHSFHVEDWHTMGRSGVFDHDYRGELLEGEIIDMTPIGSEHGGSVKWLARLFHEKLGNKAIVSVQDPIRLGDFSEPQPDIVIARPRDDYYRRSHPTPAEILLVIEVSDTSVVYDRTIKGPLYGRYAIPEYWLLNLTDRCLERYLTPTPQGYADSWRHLPGENISPGFAQEPAWPTIILPVATMIS